MSRFRETVIGLAALFIGSGAETHSQPCDDGSVSCKYIYRITVNGTSKKTGKPWNCIMTGFKVKGQPDLVTALHGVVRGVQVCGSLASLTFIAEHVKDNKGAFDVRYAMKISGIDTKKDFLYMAFAKCMSPSQPFNPTEKSYQNEGFELSNKEVTRDQKLMIQGFSTWRLRTKSVQQDKGLYGPLKALFNLEQQLEFKKLISPAIEDDVLPFKGEDVQGGESGGPIFGTTPNDKMVVFGVGNGARLDLSGSQLISWAVPVHPTMFGKREVKKIDQAIQAVVKNHNDLKIDLAIAQNAAETESIPQSTGGLRFQLPKVNPRFTFGGNLSWLFHYRERVLEFSKRPGDPGTFMDLYAEASLKGISWLKLGAYGTSSYLQYEFLRTFDNGLTFSPDPLNGSDSGRFKKVGLQASISLWRSVLWESYVGGGMLPMKFKSWQPNKRAFFGVRHYLVSRRWLAAEGRILWMSPDIQVNTWQPRLGNAVPSPQTININSFYVCAGLCLVIPHR